MEINKLTKIKIKGITKRWIGNILLVVFLVVFLVELFGILFVRQYFYDQALQILDSQIDSAKVAILKSGSTNSQEFVVSARLFAETYENKEKMEALIFSSKGIQIASSSGITYHMEESKTSDIKTILEGKANDSTYTGKNISGEHIMSVSSAYNDKSGNFMGVISFVVSLEPINRQIAFIILMIILIGVFTLGLIVLTGYYFIQSIIIPLSGINQAARKIALGDFTVRLEKNKDDEMGDLCETINYMAQELGKSEKIKNDFVSSVSHELRTPLTAIKGWAETVKNSNNKEITDKGMDIIAREATRLSELLEDLLDFSHLETGELKINFNKVDIYAELNEAVYIYERQAKDLGISLIYSEPTEVIYVVGDSNRLRQVFINVIDNAVKYSKGDGTVKVRTEVVADTLKIIISDDGVGIPNNEIENVKEKFYKVNHTVKGSGIGLAVADEIIARHQGMLDIESVENKGTTVIISLPIDKTDEVTEADLIEKFESEEQNEL